MGWVEVALEEFRLAEESYEMNDLLTDKKYSAGSRNYVELNGGFAAHIFRAESHDNIVSLHSR
jgi:hypothetical protein